MERQPGVLFIVDPKESYQRSNNLGIPVVALCDANCDPKVSSIFLEMMMLRDQLLFAAAIADAVEEGKSMGRRKSSSRSNKADAIHLVLKLKDYQSKSTSEDAE